MAKITNLLEITIKPSLPEVLSVISAVITFYPDREKEILSSIRDVIQNRIDGLDQEDGEINGNQ